MFAKCLIPKRILANTLFKRNLPILNKHLSTVNTSNEQTQNVHILDNTRFSKKFARTHYCGQLNSKNEGEKVTICGWIQTTRFKNFLILRDIKGLVQVVFDDKFLSKNGKLIEKLNEESVVSVRGTVIKRPTGQSNPKMNTGEIEVKCDYLEILNESKPNLPFTITDLNRPNETVRLKYRYLDLRFKKMQENLILRSNFVHKVRQFMQANNFLDIETPTLFRRTPGGAREFIVPTNKSGQFYCLTQSPQQFKQLLMVAGFERYYQVARCYRDENSKPDRQPEFTQIDIEMSFINENDIINLIENLIQTCWPFDTKPVTSFNKMKFEEAMNSYGVDKPDVRFDMKLNDVTNLVKQSKQTGILKLDSILNNEKFHMTSIRIPAEFGTDLLSLKEIEKLYKSVYDGTNFFNISDKDSFNFMIMKNDQSNHLTKYMSNDMTKKLKENLKIKENDILILLASNSKLKSLEILGKLRLILADLIDSKNVSKHGSNAKLLRDPKEFNFLWVVDFPLFTRNEETNKLESSHHPFTAPINEHLNMVKESKDLDSVIGLHYDLVLNGSEIAGGSIRIHNSDLQKHVLKNILEEDTSQLDHLIEALEYGAPPHGGIAIGLDRLIAILCGTSNIRNVIAFPKNQSGKDLMSSAPNIVSQEELDFYKIKIIEDNK